MRTTAFPVKHRLQNLLNCKIPLCFYCLSVLGCVSQCVRVSGADGRQANDPKPVQSHWCCTLTQKRTPVPLVPMTPRKTSSLQSHQTGALGSVRLPVRNQGEAPFYQQICLQRLCSTAFFLFLISSDLG